MHFADIITILLDSNFEGTIIRVFIKNGNEYQGRANIVKIKPHTGKDYCKIKIETGEEAFVPIDDIISVQVASNADAASKISDLSVFCKAKYGSNTDKWYIYNEVCNVYIELPKIALDKICCIKGMEAQADIINELISANPEWLYDEESWFSAEWFEI